MPDTHSPDQHSRRELGAFYTPAHVARYMAQLLPDVRPTSRILEPSGGDGALAHALIQTGRVRPNQIDVWDTNATVAPALARLGVQFSQRDSLLEAPAQAGGYSHAIGNPPYLNKQSTYIKANRAALRARYSDIGVNDTYAMFIYMTLEQLREGGQLVFLVSDTFMTLGIHRRLREHLLRTATVQQITLLPDATFPDANVHTAILHVTKAAPSASHVVTFTDARGNTAPLGTPTGRTHQVPQAELASNPGAVLAFHPDHRDVMRVLGTTSPLMSICDGGLGMYTSDNATYLAVVTHDGVPAAPVMAGQQTIHPSQVDGTTWRSYHKRGGAQRWWGPAEHAVRWDAHSRQQYVIPATALTGTDPAGAPRAGVIISGVATTLTARMRTNGAMWESNKAFAIFPKDPDRHPPAFLCALLNSAWYGTVAGALNHTVSFQARDLAALPLLPFTREEISKLARWGQEQIDRTRTHTAPDLGTQRRIDELVVEVVERVIGAASTS